MYPDLCPWIKSALQHLCSHRVVFPDSFSSYSFNLEVRLKKEKSCRHFAATMTPKLFMSRTPPITSLNLLTESLRWKPRRREYYFPLPMTAGSFKSVSNGVHLPVSFLCYYFSYPFTPHFRYIKWNWFHYLFYTFDFYFLLLPIKSVCYFPNIHRSKLRKRWEGCYRETKLRPNSTLKELSKKEND